MRRSLIVIATLLVLGCAAQAQSFSSGSTGADGALDLSNLPTYGTQEVQLPESGILNYTTVNIPPQRTLRFKRNTRNTPVIILAQGTVTVAGMIYVSGAGKIPGPGGFYGGEGHFGGPSGDPGFGPGGGHFGDENTRHGKWVGPLSLVPIVGGSGGCGGIQCTWAGTTPYGGGGGGAIVIASSQSIIFETDNYYYRGTIAADSGVVECPYGGAGNGSGGAIRLVANSITMAGSLSASGNGNGVIRLEAPSGAINFTGTSTPAAVLSTINPSIVPGASPSLTIISIGGYSVPSYAGSRFDTVDLLLPNQLTDPVSIVVRGNNIPLGTQVEVRAVSGSASAVYTPGTLSGTFASSTATATASGLNRTGVTYLIATATFEPPESSAIFNPKGPDQVAKVHVEAAPGAKPKFVFLRRDGTAVAESKLSKSFLQQFGQ